MLLILKKNRVDLSFRMFFIQIVCIFGLLSTAQSGDKTLSIREAVNAAQQNDPWLVGNQHSQDAIESMSIAADTLPDP